jgi:hypothetical protein
MPFIVVHSFKKIEKLCSCTPPGQYVRTTYGFKAELRPLSTISGLLSMPKAAKRDNSSLYFTINSHKMQERTALPAKFPEKPLQRFLFYHAKPHLEK